MDSTQQDQVDVTLKHPPISPLSLWERARVRAFFSAIKKPRWLAGFLYQAGCACRLTGRSGSNGACGSAFTEARQASSHSA
ncbi:hypothetical protein ABIA53_004435 [Pseudomonas monsensis]